MENAELVSSHVDACIQKMRWLHTLTTDIWASVTSHQAFNFFGEDATEFVQTLDPSLESGLTEDLKLSSEIVSSPEEAKISEIIFTEFIAYTNFSIPTPYDERNAISTVARIIGGSVDYVIFLRERQRFLEGLEGTGLTHIVSNIRSLSIDIGAGLYHLRDLMVISLNAHRKLLTYRKELFGE
jgi:hypothetical protein